MAHYHAMVKSRKKSDEGKLVASSHFAYIERSGVFKFIKTDEEKVESWSGNMPTWAAHDPSIFWAAADEYERANGGVYREFEGALPRELDDDARKAIVDRFIEEVLGKQHPFGVGMHNKKASDGGDQPHAHIMWSERLLDGIERPPELFFKKPHVPRLKKDGTRDPVDPRKGGCRKVNMYERMQEFRELWARLVNEAYIEAGLPHRVDHRSYAEQGLDKVPQRHLGPVRTEALHAARKEAEEAEAEALQLVDAIAAREAIAPPAQRVSAPAPAIVWPPSVPVSPSKAPAIVWPPVAPAEDPAIVWPPTKRPRTPADDHRFDSFLARLGAPEYPKAPRPSAPKPERRVRPRALQDAPQRPANPSKWHALRLSIHIYTYGVASATLADKWFIEQHPDFVLLTTFDGCRLEDHGDQIEGLKGNRDEARAMVELALMKGWGQICFQGEDDFKRIAMEEAIKAGLPVRTENDADAALLAKVRAEISGGGGGGAAAPPTAAGLIKLLGPGPAPNDVPTLKKPTGPPKP